MRSIIRSLALFPLFVVSVVVSAQAPNTLTAQEKSQGWQLLFDGKTLNGWHSQAPPQGRGRGGRAGAPPATPAPAPAPAQPGALPAVNPTPTPCVTKQSASTPAGSSHWEVVDGAMTGCGEPAGYLNSDRSYKNFVLSLEFKTTETANSGVFVRSPQEAGGYEVQIWKQQPAGYNTGSIVNTAKTARDYAFKADQWNTLQVTADGDHLVVVLNGETTLDVRDAKFPEGNIRLQYQQFPIAFRNVKLRSLP
jgi:hypothetical protein